MGYCHRHKIGWRDDDVRDEEFACPQCGGVPPDREPEEWDEDEFDDDDEEE